VTTSSPFAGPFAVVPSTAVTKPPGLMAMPVGVQGSPNWSTAVSSKRYEPSGL